MGQDLVTFICEEGVKIESRHKRLGPWAAPMLSISFPSGFDTADFEMVAEALSRPGSPLRSEASNCRFLVDLSVPSTGHDETSTARAFFCPLNGDESPANDGFTWTVVDTRSGRHYLNGDGGEVFSTADNPRGVTSTAVSAVANAVVLLSNGVESEKTSSGGSYRLSDAS